ncbi:hypothetical protein TNIN_29571 [Trichonephila inaurata madagascariensis]|uniref:Uncharacterized protein n=1 Tax=Trichonephila inaurata madagascariensis TaxID=2747483 RepID=A0A8X6Y310_9ARAC|nr:hypothetical protein TNIN_29571 [Trichonephila inaurata madagascariensis]
MHTRYRGLFTKVVRSYTNTKSKSVDCSHFDRRLDITIRSSYHFAFKPRNEFQLNFIQGAQRSFAYREKAWTTAPHPQLDGLVERFNRTI